MNEQEKSIALVLGITALAAILYATFITMGQNQMNAASESPAPAITYTTP